MEKKRHPDIDPLTITWVPVVVRDCDIKVAVVYHDPNIQENYLGGFEIVDFRAPKHPHIDWKWVDANMAEICSRLPIGS